MLRRACYVDVRGEFVSSLTMKLLGLFAGLGCSAAIGDLDLERVRTKVPRVKCSILRT